MLQWHIWLLYFFQGRKEGDIWWYQKDHAVRKGNSNTGPSIVWLYSLEMGLASEAMQTDYAGIVELGNAEVLSICYVKMIMLSTMVLDQG